MTRLQKKILAIVGFTSMVILGISLSTVFVFTLLAFFYHNSTDLRWALIESVLIPVTFIIVSFTLGLLRRV